MQEKKDKYKEIYNSFESNEKEKAKIKKDYINNLLKEEMLQRNLPFENDINMMAYILINIFSFDLSFRNWVKENIIPRLNINGLKDFMISSLSYGIAQNNTNIITNCINAIKWFEIGKIVIIETSFEGRKTIIIDSNRFKVYNYNNIFNVYEQKNHCHKEAMSLIKKTSFRQIDCIVALLKDIYGNTYYHTFLKEGTYIIDPAKNIVTDYDTYLKYYNPNILIQEEGTKILDEIKNQNENNKDFKDSQLDDILKLAIDFQMKHNM